MELSSLGFDKWFEERRPADSQEGFRPARVCAVDKGRFRLNGEHGEMQAQATGRLRSETESFIDYPAVGDWVLVEYLDDHTLAIIHDIFPRKSLLKRKTAGRRVDFQIIGANIDTACIMQSLDADFNTSRLQRYLVAVLETELAPVIFLSKCDLIGPDEREEKLLRVKEACPGREVMVFSNESGENLDKVTAIFAPAKTYCIIGSSGVGKTTLLNRLLGTEAFVTKELRKKDHGGRHTTSRRQLVSLGNGALYIDTPGMRELGVVSVDSGIEKAFPDIELLAEKCRFPDCAHTQEPGCAIQEALKSEALSPERYKSYVKLSKESEHHARSHIEKRRKDKEFGKYRDSVMGEKNKKWSK